MMKQFVIATAFLLFNMLVTCEATETIVNANYRANCMDRGCTVEDINKEVKELDGTMHQMITWDIQDEEAIDVCSYLSKMDLLVVNLQRVSSSQLTQLSQTCLQKYEASGIPASYSDSTLLNPIFYRNDKRQLTMVKDGMSAEENTKCPSMTWTRLSLHGSTPRRSRRSVKRSFSANLFAILSGKTMRRRVRNPVAQTHHTKKLLFVNVHVNEADSETTMHHCLKDVYYKINGRRRYRTIMSANIATQNGLVQVLNFRRRKIFKHCAPDQSSETSSKICISNHGRRDTFQYRLTALIQTQLKSNPTFVAFVM